MTADIIDFPKKPPEDHDDYPLTVIVELDEYGDITVSGKNVTLEETVWILEMAKVNVLAFED